MCISSMTDPTILQRIELNNSFPAQTVTNGNYDKSYYTEYPPHAWDVKEWIWSEVTINNANEVKLKINTIIQISATIGR